VLRTDLARKGANARAGVHRISIDKQPTQQYLVEKMLASVGLDLKNLQVLYIPHLPEIDALSKGTIDAALTGDPYLTMTLDRKAAVQWVRLEDVIPNSQFSFLFYGPTLLQKNPDAGRRFLIAYLKAVRQFQQGKTPHNLEVLARVLEESPDEVKRMCWPSYFPDGHIEMKQVADFQEWALKRKLIDRIATPEEFFEPKFLAQANAALDREAKHR
jgi:NitT/TauT family transport system substrate-binding protein